MKNLVLLALLLVVACEESGTKGTLSFGTSGSSSVSGPSSTAYVYLDVYAAPVSGTTVGSYSRISSCEISAGTASGTDYDCPSFSYDEGLLYNSKLKFKWGTNDASACPFIKFYPYYYRASNSAAFAAEWLNPPGTSTPVTVDCSDPEAADEADCYGGVAPLLSTLNFPSTDYFFNIVSSAFYSSVEINSSFTEERTSNRMVANPPSTYSIGAGKTMSDSSDGRNPSKVSVDES